MARSPLSDAEVIAELAHPLHGTPVDYDPLLELIGDARLVLLGEATHGTREFYHERARITRRLVTELGFDAVAIEGDWPDAYRVNRYLHGSGGDAGAERSLDGFRRFPAWMWRNDEMVELVQWLRSWNDRVRGREAEVGFYGLDLYSLHASMEAVLAYLDRVDPEAAARARTRYGCFESFGPDPQRYGHATWLGLTRSCEDEVVRQLLDLQTQRDRLLQRDGLVAQDEYFSAEQNARVVRGAEEYYRTMFRGQVASWNLRDTHMADSLDALRQRLGDGADAAKLVVWAHNSHVGDGRATQLGETGEHTLGQLVRQRYPDDAILVGFSTYAGTLTAARDWGEPAERWQVRPALPGSFEDLFHAAGPGRMLIDLHRDEAAEVLHPERLQRAIGVIYRPERERYSHYFYSHLADQFDAVVHWDVTTAVDPLDRQPDWDASELYETFPSGI